MNVETAVIALAALSHATRLSVFRLLVEAGPDGLAAGDISERMELAPSSLSFHLKALSHARLIVSRQQSRFVIYAANFDAMGELITFLTDNCCGGEPCLPVPAANRAGPAGEAADAPMASRLPEG